MNDRKVGIIGVGHVGAHVAYSLAIQGIVDELVLADTDTARVESEYQDLLDALPHMPHRTRVSIGEYEDLADCDLIVNSAGHIELLLGSDDRSRELKFTIPAVHTWVDRVRKAGFDGVVLNISNPCDVVTREIAKSLGLRNGQACWAAGTGLDSARLVTQIVKRPMWIRIPFRPSCSANTAIPCLLPGPVSPSMACPSTRWRNKILAGISTDRK